MLKYFFSGFAGYLVSLSFDRNLWWLTVFAFAWFIWLASEQIFKKRFYLTLYFGIFYFAPQLSWLRVIGIDAWILVTLLCLLAFAIVSFMPLDKRSLKSISLLGFAVVTSELIRSHIPFGGFPWALIGYSQVDGPLVSFAKLGSSSLVAFAVVFMAGLLAQIISGKFLRSLTIMLILLIVASNVPSVESTSKIKITAIQGNVPRLGLDLTSQRKAVLNNHLSLTAQYLSSTRDAEKPELIIWPESSTDIDPLRNREVAEQISELTIQNGIPILVGATTRGEKPDGLRNMGILWDATGPVDYYIKNNLVPFGEYIPFRQILAEYIDRIALVPNDYVPGNELGLFTIGPNTFGDVICFEIAFGDYVRQVVNSGSDFLTVQTNNATYGNTAQPEQQFTISRFRAIEHQRSIIVASTSGISGAIDQNGEVLAKTGQFEPAVVEVELPLNESQSFSDRFPRWFSLLALVMFLIGLVRANSMFKIGKETS